MSDVPDAASIAALRGAADDRIKVAGDILDFPEFFVADADLTYDEKAFEKRLNRPEEAFDLLTDFRHLLTEVDDFTSTIRQAN